MYADLKRSIAAVALSLCITAPRLAQGEPGGPGAPSQTPPPAGPASVVQVPVSQPGSQLQTASPEAREAAKRFAELEAKSLDLVRQIQALVLKSGDDDDVAKEREPLRKRLEETVSEAFAARQKLQQLEVDALKQRLAKVEGGVKRREEHKDQIVESRIAELLGENQELQWDPARGTKTMLAPPMIMRSGGSASIQAVPTFPGDSPPASRASQRLEGVVLAVADSDLLEVSLGAKDGLQRGQELEVFRGSTHLGELEVIVFKADRSVARITKRYDKGPIREGDRVRTASRLPGAMAAPVQAAPPTNPGGAAPNTPPAAGRSAPRGRLHLIQHGRIHIIDLAHRRVLAYDQSSGKLLWETEIAELDPSRTWQVDATEAAVEVRSPGGENLILIHLHADTGEVQTIQFQGVQQRGASRRRR